MKKPNLSVAYATSVPLRQHRRRESLAATFKRNALFERLLELKERDEADYRARTSHTLRLSIAHYAEAKAAHEEVNHDDHGSRG